MLDKGLGVMDECVFSICHHFSKMQRVCKFVVPLRKMPLLWDKTLPCRLKLNSGCDNHRGEKRTGIETEDMSLNTFTLSLHISPVVISLPTTVADKEAHSIDGCQERV